MKESPIIEEFQQEARLEKAREDILEALDEKFGKRAAAEFKPSLADVADSDQLSRLHRLAVRSSTVKQFRDRFQKA